MESKLTNKFIFKSFVNWTIWNLALYNLENMQAPSLVKMLGDIREELYPGDLVKQQELMERHLPFFNTQPFLGAIIPGIVLGMEVEKAAGADIPGELITAIKTALMGPFAGIGDALIQGTYVPILLSIGLGLSSEGELTGVLFYLIIWFATMPAFSWFMFKQGATLGAKAAELVLGSNVKDKIIKSINIIGITVVGAISCSYANLKIGYTYTAGEYVLDLNSVVNNIWPKLPVLLAAFGTYYLLAKKNMSIGKVILVYLAIAIVGTLTGVLAP